MSFVKHAFISTILVIAIFASDPLKAVSYEVADDGQFKFQVSIQSNGQHVCGGAIYTDDSIVTTSHCCKKLNLNDTIEIVAGDVRPFEDNVDKNTTQRRNISTILRYPTTATESNVTAEKFKDDICVLVVDVPLVLDGEHVDLIELDETSSPPEVGTICQVVGWGTAQVYRVSRVDGPSPDQDLLYANITVLEDQRCLTEFGEIFHLENMTCSETGVFTQNVGDKEEQHCLSDDGGPLICNGKLSGILTFVGGCESKSTSSYMTVSTYSGWLEDMSHKNDPDKSITHHINFFLVTCIIPILLGKILNE